MNSVDFLATLPKTRREVLLLLKLRGHATTLELAKSLGLSHEGVRAHILQLQTDGWITGDCESPDALDREPSTGRPSVQYCLTVAGDHAFTKRYDDLTVLLLDSVIATTDEAGLRKVLATLTDLRVEALKWTMPNTSFEEKLEIIRSIYVRDDPYVELTRDGEDWILVERNCPFLNVAMERPALCSTTVSALRRLVGFEVVRQRRFQDGDARCEFRIRINRPLGRPQRFANEPPKDAIFAR